MESGLLRPQWQKSSYSSAQGACVEVARSMLGVVAVRDSKDPAVAQLTVSSSDAPSLPACSSNSRSRLWSRESFHWRHGLGGRRCLSKCPYSHS